MAVLGSQHRPAIRVDHPGTARHGLAECPVLRLVFAALASAVKVYLLQILLKNNVLLVQKVML